MTTNPNMPATVKVWDLPVRLFHWLLLAAIAVAFLSAEGDGPLAPWHMAAGWVAAVLIAFRLAWGLVGSEHARFASFVGTGRIVRHLRGIARGRAEPTLGHNPAGGLAVLALLGLIAVTLWTGIDTSRGGEEDLHEAIGWVLLGMIVIHVAAVIATSVLTGENLARAMVTGRKAQAIHPDGRNYRPASLAGLVIALTVAGGAAWGALQLDPGAFSPQQREGSEAREGDERLEALAHHQEIGEDGDRD